MKHPRLRKIIQEQTALAVNAVDKILLLCGMDCECRDKITKLIVEGFKRRGDL